MTDNPLVEAIRLALIDSEIAFHRKRFMESKSSASMSSDVEAIGYLEHEKEHPSERRILDATAALRAIEDAGYTITPTAAPTRADRPSDA